MKVKPNTFLFMIILVLLLLTFLAYPQITAGGYLPSWLENDYFYLFYGAWTILLIVLAIYAITKI